MYSAHTAFAKELNGEAIDTAIHAIVTAKFTLSISEDPSAFKLDEFIEEYIAFTCP